MSTRLRLQTRNSFISASLSAVLWCGEPRRLACPRINPSTPLRRFEPHGYARNTRRAAPRPTKISRLLKAWDQLGINAGDRAVSPSTWDMYPLRIGIGTAQHRKALRQRQTLATDGAVVAIAARHAKISFYNSYYSI